ncbi:MAG TPA: M48 family metallopeptidase [Alphaproteobacteria bacterium]|nr:M48 family metallopeptidase [Alphaproteobacteria bacterium]
MSAASEPKPGFAARFADGRTANVREVELEFAGDALEIRQAGATLERWPYREIALVEERFGDAPMRLRHGEAAGRLTIAHGGLIRALITRAPQLSGKLRHTLSLGGLTKWAMGVGATALIVYLLIAEMPAIAARVVPLKWEEALGEAVVKQVTFIFARKSNICAQPSGTAALERLSGRLTARLKTRYRFKLIVLDHKMVNAFAAPGGHIVIMRGLIDKAEGSNEVAGVLAHEMGHVVERHSTEGLFRAIGFNLIVATLIGNTTSMGSALAELGAGLASLSYGRAAERQADAIGVKLLNRADISGEGLAAFFARIAAGRKKDKAKNTKDGKGAAAKKESGDTGGSTIWGYLSTHPPSAERARRIKAASTGRGQAMNADDWAALKAICK